VLGTIRASSDSQTGTTGRSAARRRVGNMLRTMDLGLCVMKS
jgi:hypothetical protein